MRLAHGRQYHPAVVLMVLSGDAWSMTTTDRPDWASPIVNLEQAAAWNGSEGAAWAEAADTAGGEDVLVEPLLEAATIEVEDRVLDIGCGAGFLTRQVARRAHRGEAVGIDLSAAMLDTARALASWHSLPNVRFEHGDAQVHPFAAASFDAAVSHFGIMFFDDPVAAFANIGGALRPGGRITFVCPQAMELCEWYVAPLRALLGHLPTSRSAPSRMFSLATPAAIGDVLGPAGFTGIRAIPLPAALHFGADLATAVRFYAGSGPVQAILQRPAGPNEQEVHERLAEALSPYLGPTGVRIPGAHWLVTARRPGATTRGRT
jgi:SAM-dependent methyltransferase